MYFYKFYKYKQIPIFLFVRDFKALMEGAVYLGIKNFGAVYTNFGDLQLQSKKIKTKF